MALNVISSNTNIYNQINGWILQIGVIGSPNVERTISTHASDNEFGAGAIKEVIIYMSREVLEITCNILAPIFERKLITSFCGAESMSVDSEGIDTKNMNNPMEERKHGKEAIFPKY